MISLLRGLGRLVAFLLLVVLALIGLALVVGAIVDLAVAAETIRLPAVRDAVGSFIASISAGDVAVGLACVGVALLCLLLILGIASPGRERLLSLAEQTDDGRLAARKRAVRQMAQASTARERELVRLKLSVKPTRRSAAEGRLKATAVTRPDADLAAVGDRLNGELRPVAEPFGLKANVRTRRMERNAG